jgi:D-xylose transport system substrate-binding protein
MWRFRMKKIFLILGIFAVLTGQDIAAAGKVKIGFSICHLNSSWMENYLKEMTEAAKAEGVDLIVKNANNDVIIQNQQVSEMIVIGVKAIIIIAEDSDMAVRAVEEAAEQGVPVVAFDRLIPSTKLAAYVTFDQYEIGRAQARGILKVKGKGRFVLLGGSPTDPAATRFRNGQMEILQPLIDNGKIKIVADKWVKNWDPSEACKVMGIILDEIKNKADAIVASNDGTALGALQAMKERNCAGKIPISGQDATADGCNSIVKGELTVTAFKDIRLLAPAAIKCAAALARGKKPEGLVNHSLRMLTLDESLSGDIPCVFLPVVIVDKTNVFDLIVKSGFQNYDDVYRDIPDHKRPLRP